MKLIIIEGTDNTGKDTIISKLLEKYPTVTLIHCSGPYSKKYSSKEQDTLFETYIDNIVNNQYDKTHVIIMNRSHIGEYVYGILYRNRTYTEVRTMIGSLNEKLLNRKDLEIRYVQLICTSKKLLANNEDGKSLSGGNNEYIELETERFKDVFKFCNLPKKMIYVNNGDEFKTRESIFNDVWKFIDN